MTCRSVNTKKGNQLRHLITKYKYIDQSTHCFANMFFLSRFQTTLYSIKHVYAIN